MSSPFPITPASFLESIDSPTTEYVENVDALTEHTRYLESNVQALTEETHRLGLEITDLEEQRAFLDAYVDYSKKDWEQKEEDLEEEIEELEVDANYLKDKVDDLRAKKRLLVNLTGHAQITYYALLENIREAEERLEQKQELLEITDRDLETSMKFANDTTEYYENLTVEVEGLQMKKLAALDEQIARIDCQQKYLQRPVMDASTQYLLANGYSNMSSQTGVDDTGDLALQQRDADASTGAESLMFPNAETFVNNYEGMFPEEGFIPNNHIFNTAAQDNNMEYFASLKASNTRFCVCGNIPSIPSEAQYVSNEHNMIEMGSKSIFDPYSSHLMTVDEIMDRLQEDGILAPEPQYAHTTMTL
jgi:hypothetical protein